MYHLLEETADIYYMYARCSIVKFPICSIIIWNADEHTHNGTRLFLLLQALGYVWTGGFGYGCC